MMNLRADSFVFVVHDDANVRQDLVNSLQAAGLNVEAFASGEEFLADHDFDRPGCAVVRWQLPLRSGLDVLQSLAKGAPPRSTLILMPAQTNLAEAIEAFRAGASDLFVEPAELAQLVPRLQSALAQDLPRRRHYAHWLDVRHRLERLSPAEMEVVNLLTAGLLNKQIAARLSVAVRTIELRRANIFRKMEVTSLGDLLRLVIFMEIYAQGSPQD